MISRVTRLTLSLPLQSKEQKRYKESQKEDEKQMLKRLEGTLPKSTKKQEMSRAKSEMQVKRQDKVRRVV